MVSWVPHSSTSNLSWWNFSCEFLYHFKADGLLLKLKKTHSWLQAGNTWGMGLRSVLLARHCWCLLFYIRKTLLLCCPHSFHLSSDNPLPANLKTVSPYLNPVKSWPPVTSLSPPESLTVSFVTHSGHFLLPDTPRYMYHLSLLFCSLRTLEPIKTQGKLKVKTRLQQLNTSKLTWFWSIPDEEKLPCQKFSIHRS